MNTKINEILQEIESVIVGKNEIVEKILMAILAQGHVLMEDVPGVGKTTTAMAFAKVLGLETRRVQFTSDTVPSDIIGFSVYDKKADEFVYKPGAIMTNLLLADEINRTSSKTQSALLEAMQEHTVTVMGVSRKLSEPFFVLATQNPIEQDGTYPLPEAQMDRFMFKLVVPNPSLDELMQIVDMTQKTMDEVADSVCNGEQLLKMRETANQIPVAEEVMRYAMILTSATHPDSECASEAAKKYIRVGASPRAGQALISAAKVMALIKGRFNVAYNDIEELAYPVLRHRIKMNFEAIAERISPDEAIKQIIEEVDKKYKNGKK